MKTMHIVGARPQFIKMAMVARSLKETGTQTIIHTGQHYDENLSDLFFRQLNIAGPAVNLNVGSGSHAEQTAQMLVGIEKKISDFAPDWVLVYGDTNSTLAGALVAAKLNYPLVHIEAGLRSFNRSMPEEINRIIADHLSQLLFCPTQTAVDNLSREGIEECVYQVGDVMADALLHFQNIAEKESNILKDINLTPRGYALLTLHRAGNTDNKERLSAIISGLRDLPVQIVFPVHPRAEKMLGVFDIILPANIIQISPVGYLDMIMLEKNAECILTDSGGVQKEAYILGVRCLTLRDETEWTETVEAGWNVLVGAQAQRIITEYNHFLPKTERKSLFGNGDAAQRMTNILNIEKIKK